MIRNYIKIAWRNFTKNKTYSFLNVFGLAVGMACAGLIFLWVENEMGYDKFHTKKDQLYFLRVNQKYDTYVFTHGSTPGVMGPAIQQEIPGIARACRATEGTTSQLFTIGNKSVYASGRYADTSFFELFTLPFVQGNIKNAFSQLYSVVITEKTAVKFFGTSKNVLGKTLRVDNQQDYVVSGVLKDIPINSSLQFEWISPFKIYYDKSPWAHEWGNGCLSTYVELKPGASIAAINNQLKNYIQKRAPASISHPFLFSMNNWHLYDKFENGKLTGGGQIEYVRLFSFIAWIILLIACINFMNLATARSEKRAREVGVRKVAGAGKQQLIFQFMGEALLMTFMAAVISVLIMALSLPAFNLLVQKELSMGLGNPLHLFSLLLIALICGLLAGSYPALYLSSFNPVSVLKGMKAKAGTAVIIRKGLVVLQFAVSIALIIGTIIIYQQIQHVKSRNLGFDKNNLIEVSAKGNTTKNFPSVKQDLLNTGVVTDVALSDHVTLYGGNNTDGMAWAGKAPGSKVLISGRNVTPEFFKTSGINFIEGRSFEETDSLKADGSSKKINVIITSALAKMLGEGSALGKTLYNEGDPTTRLSVIGVVNDYVYGNMYGKPDPVMFMMIPHQYASQMYVRTKPGVNTEQVIAKISAVMKKDNPAYPFEFRFVDEQFNQMFMSEALIGKLSQVFAALAIVISCLGLFGVAAYTAELRTKEIGIRKVLGASVSGITALLSGDFLKLVALSALVAFPVSWWAMNSWLQGYAYRIGIQWWVFVVAGVLAVMIALFTISFQAIKAALANPVRSLRSE